MVAESSLPLQFKAAIDYVVYIFPHLAHMLEIFDITVGGVKVQIQVKLY